MKLFTCFLLITNIEVNLLAVLMMSELLIHNVIKGYKVCDMKQFTSYLLTANTDVNLHAVLMMCELSIHNIIKKMKQEI